VSGYESPETISTLERWYNPYKERAFIWLLAESISQVGQKGRVLEVGGGTGTHGALIATILTSSYIHSDYSYGLCRAARSKGLRTVQMDALQMPVKDSSIDCIVTVGVSTIIRGATIRFAQFDAFYRALRPGGELLLITSRLAKRIRQHCIDQSDIDYLISLGFSEPKITNWGFIPGSFWQRRTFRVCKVIERLLSPLNIGVRRIVALRKQ
jgi:SAM-dependent methyltransferase